MKFETPKKIVFFGDSVTEGCFELYPTDYGFDTVRRPENAYPAIVTRALKERYGENAVTVNAGRSGDNSKKGLARIEADVLSLRPDIVTVAFGLNDIFRPDGFEENYGEILHKISLSGARVIVVTPNMLCTYIHPEILPESMKVAVSAVRAQTDGTLDLIHSLSVSLAEKYDATVCDVYLYWKNLYSRGVDTTAMLANFINHPSPKMHEETARLLLEAIENI